MDPSGLGVVLDSSIAIDAEREQLNVADFLRKIAARIGEREACLSVITVAELAHGIYRADTLARRQRRRIFLDELKAALPVYPITEITAELVGRIGAESAARRLCSGTRVCSGHSKSAPLRWDSRTDGDTVLREALFVQT